MCVIDCERSIRARKRREIKSSDHNREGKGRVKERKKNKIGDGKKEEREKGSGRGCLRVFIDTR